MRILDHLEPLPEGGLDAFITRLEDTEDKVRANLRSYVVADAVRERLDVTLREVGGRLADGRDVGRFVYGSFGSGKSHLMTVLGKMLERDEEVYDLGHRHLRVLRQAHPWLDERRTLVVRLNMMGKHSLVSALYEAYNRSLPAGVAPLAFTSEERVFSLLEQDAARLPGGMDDLLGQAVGEGAIPAARYFEKKRQGSQRDRLSLAAQMLTWRDHGEERIRPDDLWLDAPEGFDRIARHAQEHGFDGIAWLIDELVIWIREKDRATYIKQINDLSSLVDSDAARVVPFFAAVAVQMDIAETCPDDISEKGFREHLSFIADRFRPPLMLEDTDLYEVCSQRVLARRSDLAPATLEEFERAVGAVMERHADNLRELSGEVEPALVRALYPFHPALLRVLVDVTQALSRSRTAIAALYGLLRAYPDLEVGHFIPLGALWDIVLTADNVQALRGNVRSTLAQRLADTAETWARLEGKVESAVGTDETAAAELRQLVRSALLCQLSDRPYFPDGRPLKECVTASTLLRLNETDVRALTWRTGVSKVAKYFRDLSAVAPEVQVTGQAADPSVFIRTDHVDIDRPLRRARADVRHENRFAYIRQVLVEQLGLNLGTGNEGKVQVTWRGTKRSGKVRLANVRKLSYAGKDNEFDAGAHAFLLLVDYPFDEESGRSRQDDIERVEAARARAGQWSLAWLPAHFGDKEREALDNTAAVELIRRDKRRYLGDYAPQDADRVAKALEGFQTNRRLDLEDAVRRVYFDEGQVHALRGSLDGVSVAGVDRGRAVETLGSFVLDKRYPGHPAFTRRVGVGELTQVGDWVVRAAQTGQAVDLSSFQMTLADAVAVPLEVVHKGASTITPRRDGRYLRSVLDWVGDKRRFQAAERRDRLMAEGGWKFGLTREVADLFLFYLLQVEGYEAQRGDRSFTVEGVRLPDRFTLVKDDVVDAPTWEKAVHAAERLLGVTGRAELPTSPEQAKLSREAVPKAGAVRTQVQELHGQVGSVLAWAAVGADESERLKTATAVLGWLNELMGNLTNAGRARRLAHGQDNAEAWLPLVGAVGAELSAVADLQASKLAFETVRRLGTDEDQTKIVRRLQNLLKDPVTRPLSDHAREWAAAAGERATELMRGSLIPREEVLAHVEAKARERLDALEGDYFRVNVVVERGE